MARDTSAFARMKVERTSEAGQAAIDIAQQLFEAADTAAMLVEARQWVALALDCDKAIADGKIAEMAAKIAAKARRHEIADKMRAMLESDAGAQTGRH